MLPGDGDLTRLTAHTVTRRILDLSHRYSVAFTKYWVSAVRVLLRYLFAHGKIATDLIEGRRYFILPTTAGGLYRYQIHDLVRCVGFHGRAPVRRRGPGTP